MDDLELAPVAQSTPRPVGVLVVSTLLVASLGLSLAYYPPIVVYDGMLPNRRLLFANLETAARAIPVCLIVGLVAGILIDRTLGKWIRQRGDVIVAIALLFLWALDLLCAPWEIPGVFSSPFYEPRPWFGR